MDKMQMPCLHEQLYFWTYGERSDRESKAFEVLPDTIRREEEYYDINF